MFQSPVLIQNSEGYQGFIQDFFLCDDHVAVRPRGGEGRGMCPFHAEHKRKIYCFWRTHCWLILQCTIFSEVSAMLFIETMILLRGEIFFCGGKS